MLHWEERAMKNKAKKLRDENNRLEKRLNVDVNDILTDIVVYIRSCGISDLNQELVRRDITQMLINGQERGESPAEVIGDDYKAFCDSVMAEMPKLSTKQLIMTAIRDVLPAFMILFAAWAFMTAIKQALSGEAWYITPLSISNVIIGAALLAAAAMTAVYITKNSFNTKPAGLVCILLLIIAAALAAALLLPEKIIFSPHIAADMALLAVLLIAYKLIDGRL